jgi:hypothetical protein
MINRVFNISAVFHFFARNPPSIAIAGGILMWILGTIMGFMYGNFINPLLEWAPTVFFSGIVLQVIWLIVRYVFPARKSHH